MGRIGAFQRGELAGELGLQRAIIACPRFGNAHIGLRPIGLDAKQLEQFLIQHEG